MRKNNQLTLFLLLVVVYICTVFLPPIDPEIIEKYHLSLTSAYLLSLSIVVPLVAVWICAFYGYWALKRYAETVKDTIEGRGLGQLAKGLMILAFSLPTLASVASIFNYLAESSPQYLQIMVIIHQLIIIAFPLVAFMMISNGAEELTSRLKKKMKALQNYKLLSLLIIVFSSLFCWTIIALADKNASPQGVYSLPEWLIVVAVVVPYLYMWYRGIMAVYYLSFYKDHVRGHVYKQAFGYLSQGLAAVILLAICIQFLAVLTPQLQRLNFTPILIILYILVAMYALGYGMIAVGAKKLKRIEEV